MKISLGDGESRQEYWYLVIVETCFKVIHVYDPQIPDTEAKDMSTLPQYNGLKILQRITKSLPSSGGKVMCIIFEPTPRPVEWKDQAWTMENPAPASLQYTFAVVCALFD